MSHPTQKDKTRRQAVQHPTQKDDCLLHMVIIPTQAVTEQGRLGEGSTAVGKFNDDGDALFVVGNGTADNIRKDVLKVDRDGFLWIVVNGVLTKLTLDEIINAINARGNNLV